MGCPFLGVVGLYRMIFTMGLAVAFAMLQMESFCFLEFVTLTTRQREADQPHRKENLTQKFHAHPFTCGATDLQLTSSPLHPPQLSFLTTTIRLPSCRVTLR